MTPTEHHAIEHLRSQLAEAERQILLLTEQRDESRALYEATATNERKTVVAVFQHMRGVDKQLDANTKFLRSSLLNFSERLEIMAQYNTTILDKGVKDITDAVTAKSGNTVPDPDAQALLDKTGTTLSGLATQLNPPVTPAPEVPPAPTA